MTQAWTQANRQQILKPDTHHCSDAAFGDVCTGEAPFLTNTPDRRSLLQHFQLSKGHACESIFLISSLACHSSLNLTIQVVSGSAWHLSQVVMCVFLWGESNPLSFILLLDNSAAVEVKSFHCCATFSFSWNDLSIHPRIDFFFVSLENLRQCESSPVTARMLSPSDMTLTQPPIQKQWGWTWHQSHVSVKLRDA